MISQYGLEPVDLDKHIIGLSMPFLFPDIMESTRCIDDYLYALVGRSQQFIEDLEQAIIEHPNFEKSLEIIKEVLSRVVSTKNAIEATCRELETQLGKSRMELATARKIQAKTDKALVVANKEVNCLESLLIEEQFY